MEDPRERQETKENMSANSFNSNVYNSGDSFINDDDDESSFDAEDFSDPEVEKEDRRRRKKAKKRKKVPARQPAKKKSRLKKMKESRVAGMGMGEEADGFVVHGGEFAGERAGSSDVETGVEYDTQRMLENIFNDKEYQEEAAAGEEEDEDEEEDVPGGEVGLDLAHDISRLMNPEERQKHFLTLKDRRIKERDIPERLQLRFESRPPPTQEDIVHESRWIAEKLLRRKGLIERSKEALEIKIYAVLENLLWKNQEIMYIWTYSRQEITSNLHGDPNADPNNELKLDDLWFIYEQDRVWQRCFEMKLAIANMVKLLRKHQSVPPLVERALERAGDLPELNVCYQYLKFSLKIYMDEEEIETYLENKNKVQQPQAKGEYLV